MMTGLSMSTMGVRNRRVGRMLDAGGGSGATLPDWVASIFLGGASWIPAMAAVSLVVASMIQSVAVISGTRMA
jgi:hypothetical protein